MARDERYNAVWRAVRKAVRYLGINGTPKFDDPITAAAVDAFGWRFLCLSTDPEIDRLKFFEMYELLEEVGV